MRKIVLILAFMLIASGTAFAQVEQPLIVEQPIETVTISLDKTVYRGGDTIKIEGKAPPGRPVYIEIASEARVQVARLDSRRDPDTGRIPWIFTRSRDIPALYMILMPKEVKEAYEMEAARGRDWSVSRILAMTGADTAYLTPGKGEVRRWQASVMATIIGSKGEVLAPFDERANRRASMPLMKARFRWPERMLSPTIEIKEDGTFRVEYKLPYNAPSGAYTVTAVVDKDIKSAPITFEHDLPFGKLYFARAGQSLNVLGPFLLAVAICTFGVIFGAGGGFILGPLLIVIYGIPHAIVAGTIFPTVLFSQSSGIYNYSRIKFINFKLGIGIGLAMLAGGFIGPLLTQFMTLEQFRFVFGWILLILAGIMVWQTTPGFLERNKRENAILKEFKKRAEDARAARLAAIEEAKKTTEKK